MKQMAVIAILICTCLGSIANDTITFKNKLDLSISSISLSDGSIRLGGYGFSRLKYNRNINDFISVGGYGGFGWFNEFKFEKVYGFYHYTARATVWKYAVQYGLNSKLHLLPLILKTNLSKLDCYLSGDIGLMSMFTTPSDNIFPERGTYFDYSFMGGVSVFLSKRIGLFIEVGYRDFKFHQGSNAEFGLSYRF